MDTTPEYVKMCEKAEEIQTSRLLIQHEFGDMFHSACSKVIWLPRQDQLQEIVRSKYPIPWTLAKVFAQMVYHLSGDTSMSMEQLWLAFVMKELYHKIWYNGGWRLENDRVSTDSTVASQ